MVFHFGIAGAVAASPVVLAGAAAVDGVVVVVYAAGAVVEAVLLTAVRGVHLLRFIHGDDGPQRGRRRRRRPRGRGRKSTQILTRLDRDGCCRHSIHWRTREFFACSLAR